MIKRRRAGRGRVVELPVAGPVQEALPLVAVEDEDPLLRVTGHAQQDPLGFVRGDRSWGLSWRLGPGRGSGWGSGERDLDRAVALAGALPGLGRQVDAELEDRGFAVGHGFLATPQ